MLVLCQLWLNSTISYAPFEQPFGTEPAPAAPALDDNNTIMYKEITFTDLGWFQPDDKKAIEFERSWVTRELVDSVLLHERFNQSAWKDLKENPDPSRPILAFLDVDSCNHLHYPRFGQDWIMASDTDGGRKPMMSHDSLLKVCPAIERALRSPAMAAPESRLVAFNCEENGIEIAICMNGTRDEIIYSKLVVGHLSAHTNHVHPHDFGIPPLPVKSIVLNETQLDETHSCRVKKSRPYLFSFTGRRRLTFPQYHTYWEPLHGQNGVHAVFTFKHYEPSNVTNLFGGKVLDALPPEHQTRDAYCNLLMQSIFAGAPRGDNLYSVRFSEILSAATIPVVYSDGWVLPYNQDVVDWSDLAVLLPEKHVNQTMDILLSMSKQETCQRQQRILEFYNNYVADHGRLRAVLKLMDARINRASHEITNFTAAPGQ